LRHPVKFSCRSKEGCRFVITIFVDDEPWMDIHTKIFGRNFSLPLFNTLEQLQEHFKALEYARAKKYTLDRLAMRSYPSMQLKKLLEKNLVSAPTIEKILKEFARLGYLNDEEWIERFIKSHLARHAGPQMIIAKLINKGISPQEAEKRVERFIDGNDIQKSIQHLLKTKYKNRCLTDYREKQKVFAALVRKGFDSHAIKTAIRL
jgi:regulatory protein